MRVADGVYVSTDSSGMVNASIIQLDDGLVVVDTLQQPLEAQRITSFAADELKLPIKAVVITHEHFDHTGGLPAFSVPIIASEVTAQSMANAAAKAREASPDAHQDAPLPSVTFGNRLTIRGRDRQLQLVQTGGHTPGSAYLLIPELKVLFTGDLVVEGNPYMANGDLKQWLEVLQHLKSLSPEIVVVGHGKPSGPEIIDRLAAKLILFREAVLEKSAQGKSADQITSELISEQGFQDRWREMVMTTVRRLLAGA